MTEDTTKLVQIRDMIENAEANLRSAKQLLNSFGELPESVPSSAAKYEETAAGLNVSATGEEQVIEGVFDGQNMIGPNKKAYPVPANYASKSKLVPGDVLKLTIAPSGAFIYKQISPIERQHIKGVLAYEDGQYKVISDSTTHNVLLASVTYFKAEPGDEITLIVPEKGESEWGAIENVIPRLDAV